MFSRLHRRAVKPTEVPPISTTGMAQSDSKLLVLGALAGVAGISVAVMCYQGFRSSRRRSWAGYSLQRTNKQDPGIMLVDGPGLSGGQAEVLERLEDLIHCVSELKDEMKALKNALPTLPDQVREELRGRDLARRASPSHRTTPTRRKRAAGTITGARAEGRSSEEAESEGGYITALTDSEEEELSDKEDSDKEQPADSLSVLLERLDRLHHGTESDKQESLNILLEHREKMGQNSFLLWRLVRAYCDVHDISSTLDEKRALAENELTEVKVGCEFVEESGADGDVEHPKLNVTLIELARCLLQRHLVKPFDIVIQMGKKVGEEAVNLNPTCAESHRWYAIICGMMAEYDTIQNKIKNGYIFKDHLDKAIELKPQDPTSYYLLGRWCYAVAQLSWLERKVAATLFGEPPSATIEDALKNFLKVEELHPRYSKTNYVFLAKCYKDLGQREKARIMCEAACSMISVSKEDEEAQKELDILCPTLGL